MGKKKGSKKGCKGFVVLPILLIVAASVVVASVTHQVYQKHVVPVVDKV